jgi:hypothetical protein
MTHEEQRIWLINELQKEDNELSNYPRILYGKDGRP